MPCKILNYNLAIKGFHKKNCRMLNVYNIGLARCITVKVAILDSITQIDFTHTRCPHLILDRGHNVCLLAPLHGADNVYGQRKSALCLVVIQPMCNSCFFSTKIRHILLLSLIRFSAVDT